jgi:ABC-type lipoprotein export system ATPase subunit
MASQNVTPPSSNSNSETKRVNVIFTPQQYQLLKDLAARQGITLSDLLRQSLALTKLIVEADLKGEKILIDKDGQMQQLKLVR